MPYLTKKASGLLLASLLSAEATADIITHPQRRLVDRIVAIVDSKPILASTIRDKLEPNAIMIKVSPFPLSAEAPHNEQALEDEINLALVLRKAKELELNISDSQIDQQIEQIIAQSNSTLDGLKSFLHSQGKTFEAYREDIREQMLIYQFQGRVIMPMVKGAQIREQSRFKKAQANSANVFVTTRQIMVNVDSELSGAEKEKRKQLINTIYQRLVQGMPFREAENLYSDLDTGRSDMPSMETALKDLLPQIAEKVSEIDPAGAVKFTQPIRTSQGWHIFYVEKQESKGTAPNAEEQHAEVSRLLQEQIQIWLRTERAKAKIEVKRS